MNIVLYPDPRLRAKNKPITSFDEALAQTVRDMFNLMYKTDGVGLAAPQVGHNVQLLVFNPSGDKENSDAEVVLCNPKITAKSKDKEFGEEGCLSFPHIRGSIARHVFVRIEALDLQGNTIEVEFRDWEARVFQHEYDHLQGIVFVERMTAAEKSLARPELAAMKAEWAAAHKEQDAL